MSLFIRRCRKCGDNRVVGPRYVERYGHEFTGNGVLQFQCGTCGFKWTEPTADADQPYKPEPQT